VQLTELVKFLLVLAVFIVSFGVAFQAILHPNQTPSYSTFIDIVWRPYWQMFGELFLDDVSIGMGSYPAAEYYFSRPIIIVRYYGIFHWFSTMSKVFWLFRL